MTTPRFTVLIPVKDGQAAKTRLDAVGAAERAELMTAFARDAITAALATPRADVQVVGDPAALEPLLGDLGVVVVPDEGDGDLNRALARAAARVASDGHAVAAMLGDLPCLRPGDLDAALAAGSPDGRWFVADTARTGTTLLAAGPGVALQPLFGRGSAGAHLRSGAVPVEGELTSLRLDVDTSADLERALRFGVGPNTARTVRALGLVVER